MHPSDEGTHHERAEPYPDQPVPFGYKSAWLAVRTEDTQAVAAALHLKNARRTTWAEGITQAQSGSKVFVAPAISGWTLVVGTSLPYAGHSTWIPFLLDLSRVLGLVQYFGTDRVTEYHAWARSERGHLVRAYAYSGEQGQTLCNIGVQTSEGQALGFDFFDETRDDAATQANQAYSQRSGVTYPEEEAVLQLAESWSVDPTQLYDQESEGLGVLGEFWL